MDSTETISEKASSTSYDLFGELLVSQEILSREDLDLAIKNQRKQGGRLGEVLVRLGILEDEVVTHALADHLSLEYVNLDNDNISEIIDINIARTLPESIATRFKIAAIREHENKVAIAMADPLNVIAIDTVTLKLKRQIKPIVSSMKGIKRAIEHIYHGSDVEEQRLRDIVELEGKTLCFIIGSKEKGVVD